MFFLLLLLVPLILLSSGCRSGPSPLQFAPGAMVLHLATRDDIPTLDPVAIASAINSLNRARIDACKRKALAVAEKLCWERESSRLVDAYRQLLPEIALG